MMDPESVAATVASCRASNRRLAPLLGPPTAPINLVEFAREANASLARARVMRDEFDIELNEEMGDDWKRCRIGFEEDEIESQRGEGKDFPLLRIDETVPIFHTTTRLHTHNNTLHQLLLTRSKAQTTPHEHLDRIKIQITIQPIISSEKNTTAPFPLRTQTLVLLASNTLKQFQDNILAGGDAIPVQKQESEDEEDSEEDDPMEEKEKVVKWGEERSNPGSCLVFDGLIYADEAEGRSNYTQMIMKAIEETDWTAEVPSKRAKNLQSPNLMRGPPLPVPSFLPATVPPSVSHPLRALHEASLAAQPLSTSTLGNSKTAERGKPNRNMRGAFLKPNYERGGSMQDTMVADLGKRGDGRGGLKVGMSGLYLHQGNCEHIWVIDWIRYEHPNDPPIKPMRTAADNEPLPADAAPPLPPAPPADPIDEDLPTLDDLAAPRAIPLPAPTLDNQPIPLDTPFPSTVVTPATFVAAPVAPTYYPAPYPLTTHLSKHRTIRCKFCEIGVSSIIVVENELAGVSPAHMCRNCFRTFFGREEGEEDYMREIEMEGNGGKGRVRVIPSLTEYDAVSLLPAVRWTADI